MHFNYTVRPRWAQHLQSESPCLSISCLLLFACCYRLVAGILVFSVCGSPLYTLCKQGAVITIANEEFRLLLLWRRAKLVLRI